MNQLRSLEEATDRLRRAQKAGRLGTWDWNVMTNDLAWDGVEAVHGLPEGSFGGTFEGYIRDMHPDDQPTVLAAIEQARSGGADLYVQYRIVIPDGSTRWVEGRGTCFQNEQGITVRMAGTCQDITDRKLAEQQKEDLFSFASHELRTPLTSILGFARLLEKKVAASPESFDALSIEAIGTIREESLRMAEIVETFLDLARAESRRLDIKIERFDLTELLQDECERLSYKSPSAMVDVSLPATPVMIESDLRRVRQVVSNLLDNAVKYGGEPPSVWLSCEVNAGWVDVRVKDNGPGVAEKDRQKIFDRFYRGESSNGTSKGLGIGLYLSRQFIERLGGTLSIVSEPGESTEFMIMLPLMSKSG